MSTGDCDVWVLIPMVGLYLSVRLILDGDYGVPGF